MRKYNNLYAVTSDGLVNMNREELIGWLVWNDQNGVYRDEESLAEFGEILSKEEAYWIALRQIGQN
jgi:hypothetical protein